MSATAFAIFSLSKSYLLPVCEGRISEIPSTLPEDRKDIRMNKLGVGAFSDAFNSTAVSVSMLLRACRNSAKVSTLESTLVVYDLRTNYPQHTALRLHGRRYPFVCPLQVSS